MNVSKKETNKEYIFYLIAFAALALILFNSRNTPQVQSAGTSGAAIETCSSNGIPFATSTQSTPTQANPAGTSTPLTFSLTNASASTTVICSMGGADLVSLDIYAKASSSAATLLFTEQYGSDLPFQFYSFGNNVLSAATTSPAIEAVDWYNEDCLSDVQANSSRPHTNVCLHSLSLATSTNATASSFIRKNITFTAPPERYLRVNLSVSGDNATVNLKVMSRLKSN